MVIRRVWRSLPNETAPVRKAKLQAQGKERPSPLDLSLGLFASYPSATYKSIEVDPTVPIMPYSVRRRSYDIHVSFITHDDRRTDILIGSRRFHGRR